MPLFEFIAVALAGLIGGAYGTLVGAGNMLAMPLLKMLWLIGIILFISMAIGSYIGAHYSDRIGNVWLKRIFIATAAIMALKLLL